MAEKLSYIGQTGPFTYNDTDTYADLPSVTVEGARFTGQIRVEETPTDDKHVLRLEDMATLGGRLQTVEVADIDAPAAELLTLAANFEDGQLLVREDATGYLSTMYIWDTDISLVGDQSDGAYVVKGAAGHWVALTGVYADGDRNFGGDVVVRGTLGVTGASTFTGAVSTGAGLLVGTTLGVTGAATLSSTLGVTGLATFNLMEGSGLTLSFGLSALTVIGTSSVTSQGTLAVTGAATLSSTLSVGETTCTAGMTVADAPVNPTDVARLVDIEAGGGQVQGVADMTDPSAEMNLLAGTNEGDRLIIFGTLAGDEVFCEYIWDPNSHVENVPFTVDGSSGHWHALAGTYGIDIILENNLHTTGITSQTDTEKHIGFVDGVGAAFNPENVDLDFSLDDDVADDALHMRGSDGYIGMRIAPGSITDPVHIGEDVRFDAEVHGTRWPIAFSAGAQTANPDAFEFYVGAAAVNGNLLGVNMPDAGSILGFTIQADCNNFSSGSTITWNVLVDDVIVMTTDTVIAGTGEIAESVAQARDTDAFSAGARIRVSASKSSGTVQVSNVAFTVDTILDDMNA